MSLQWTLIAVFLYVEIAIIALFILPFISAKKWHKFFKSRMVTVLSQQANWYFGIVVITLIIFLLDAIREMRKYSNKELTEGRMLESELQTSMRLFRAQRNFYISGFSLFLSIVIRRFVTLFSNQATLMAENEAVLKQAKSATEAARRGLLNDGGSGEAAQNVSNEAHQEEVNKLKSSIEKLEEEVDTLKTGLEKAKTDRDAALSQAKSVETEYDRLSEEHKKLEQRVKILSGGSENKKDD